MKALTLIGLAGLGGLLLASAPAQAGVNCGIIKKDLEMGRTPEDISERMVIPVEEVKKCQAEEKKADAPAAAEKAPEEQKPAQ